MNFNITKKIPSLIMLLIFLVFMGCSSNYQWGWYVILPNNKVGLSNIEFLVGGLGYTIILSVISISFAILLGLIVSVASISKNKALYALNIGYTEIIRAIPVLVMILWVYYGLPVLLNLNFTAFTAGIIALSICESPFIAEIFRSGIQAVPKGQKEAGLSMGMNFFQIFYHITLPQAVRIILPALGNQFVYMLKMSSLVSIIGLNELTRKANELVVSQYRPLEIYTFLVLEYLVLILIVSLHPFIGNWLRYFVGAPMHCGLRSDISDFRKCVRTITLNPISEFLYWHMNWHLEHHMFAAVPCYNLKKLYEAVAEDMPKPRTLINSWQEMLVVVEQQQSDPAYEFDTPVPPQRTRKEKAQQLELEASIGDLAPMAIA